jgi:hypothetical protein
LEEQRRIWEGHWSRMKGVGAESSLNRGDWRRQEEFQSHLAVVKWWNLLAHQDGMMLGSRRTL